MFFGTARFRGAYLDTDYIVRSNEDVVVIRIGLESPMVDLPPWFPRGGSRLPMLRARLRSTISVNAWELTRIAPRAELSYRY
jgi:hypothetical protein